MNSRKLSKEIANEIYDILVEDCGAPDRSIELEKTYLVERGEFVREFSEKDNPTKEWRFCGRLGFGGKFWHNNDRFYVSCYAEDRTEEREEMMNCANEKLEEVYEKYTQL